MDGVTIAGGSMFEISYSETMEETVAKAGTIDTARFNSNGDSKDQIVIGGTVTSSSGSIKIVLGITDEYSYSAKNVKLWDDDDRLSVRKARADGN